MSVDWIGVLRPCLLGEKDSVSERTLKWRPHSEARGRSRGGILLLGSTLSRLGIGSHACSSVRQSPAIGSGLCPAQGLPLDPSSRQTPGSKHTSGHKHTNLSTLTTDICLRQKNCWVYQKEAENH